MPGRGATIILLLVFGLLCTGCVSGTAGQGGTATPGGGTPVSTTTSPDENQTYAYARGLVPTEIPGFVLVSRAKEPMSIWTDPYHFHSFWIPNNTSEFNGSVEYLSVDVFVYGDREEALAWLSAFEADSDGTLIIQGIDTTYRYRGGVAEVVFMRDDVIVLSSSIADRSPAGPGPDEGAAREAAVAGAEALIRNLS